MTKIKNMRWIKDLLKIVLPIMLIAVTASCSKMDDYKKYVEGGEISYTGKLDTVDIFSGHNRVFVKGLLNSDPKVKKIVIYWNNMVDSIIIPAIRTANNDSLEFYIDGVQEGVQNFIIYTYDDEGNKSIPVYKTGRVYGSRYQATLTDRGLSAISNGAVTTIDWSGMDRLSGVFATELVYQNTSGEEQTLRIPIDENKTVLNDLDLDQTSFKYRTLFLPDTMSVDTFYTSFVDKKIDFINITSKYLKNTSKPFATSARGSRWGVLADWTVSASVKNASGMGSWDKNNDVIAVEGGWGLPDVPNGKIYQTITLPAGKYTFRVEIFKHGATGAKSIVVAAGNTLPNSADVASSSLAYLTLPSSNANASVVDVLFELTQEQQVSLGFVMHFINTSSAGQYFNARGVSLYQNQ